VVLGFDRQGWITVFTNYTHVDLLGAACVDLPQQAGIPCIAAAVESFAIEPTEWIAVMPSRPACPIRE
jgi:hypothetical protein